MFSRWYSRILQKKLGRPYVHVLFGARQTGKSTLLKSLLSDDAIVMDFSDPVERMLHTRDIDAFKNICLAMPKAKKPVSVFVDEVQNVPHIFDSVQNLYDSDKTRWKFILCGSSARKLRKSGTNLLPGRAFLHHLYPVMLCEQRKPLQPYSVFPLKTEIPDLKGWNPFPPDWTIEERLAYGSLPGVITAAPSDRGDILRGYAAIHLEEEIRREALVKDWGAFLRFLRLAATESGKMLNYASISREAGISMPTVKSHYQLLEEMFVGFHVPAYSGSARKNLLSTSKFIFFDIGVRNAAASIPTSIDSVLANPGPVFEQWVGIELWKRIGYLGNVDLNYLRTKDGYEIDYIIRMKDGTVIPIEVKWTDSPNAHDAKNIEKFVAENKNKCSCGFIICRASRAMKINENTTALPWKEI